MRDFLFDVGRVTEVDAGVILLQILMSDAITCVLMLSATPIIWTLDSDIWRGDSNPAEDLMF